jgi:hypothetical protein
MRYVVMIVLSCVFFGAVSSRAEFRVWSSKDGVSNVEAQYIQMAGPKVVLEKKDGTRTMVPMTALCAKDQEYLASVIPPKVEIDVDKDVSSEKLYESGYSTKERDKITINATIKKVSKAPCSQKLKVYVFVVAKSYIGGSRLVVGKADAPFSFEKQGAVFLKADGSVSYWDSYGSGKQGWKYEGYIVVVENEKGQVIAVESNKSTYEKNWSKIKVQKVGDGGTIYSSDSDVYKYAFTL